jgi:hypothetical protein
MQSGIVTSMSDYELADKGSDNLLIRHNLPSAGGASGSPIFTPNGVVIGLHNAGNQVFGLLVKGSGQDGRSSTQVKDRIANASLINFGQRVDLLWDIIPKAK